ncbi:MAG: hypothetical protein CMO40_09715 [Verrucomicrobiaceae bacterium]|nr:hypothetical protein [Verrucomicrobiaceae bacterium]
MNDAMTLPRPLQILNGISALLFLAFAAFQANDIDREIYHKASSLDAALWLAFYALIALLFALTFWRRPAPVWLLLAGALACLLEMSRTGWGLWINLFGEKDFTMMQFQMTAEDPRVELTREFFGALIALVGVGILWWERRKFATAGDFRAGSEEKVDGSR